jgi:spore germination protein YaaH
MINSAQKGIALLIFMLICSISINFIHTEMAKPAQIWGYYPYWLKDEWKKIDLALYDQVLFFEIPLSTDKQLMLGSDVLKDWRELAKTAKNKGSHLQLTFTLFDMQQFNQIFSSEELRRRLQDEMINLTEQTACSGLQLDFEIFGAVSKTSANGFRQFLKSLKHDLAEKTLSLFVLTEDSAGLYDKNSLMIPDYIVIQGYDAHWKKSANAGPVSLLHGSMADSWDTSLKHFLSLGVPRNKILMSIPYYGYEWPTINDAPGALTRGEGREISFAPLPAGLVPEIQTSATERIQQYGLRRDVASGSPFYVFRDETGWKQGWFEDETSLSAKFNFINEQHLAGVAVFSMAYDGENFQGLLRRHFRQ